MGDEIVSDLNQDALLQNTEIRPTDFLKKKLFNFVYELEATPALAAELKASNELVSFSRIYRARLLEAKQNCMNEAVCYLEKIALSDADVENVETALLDRANNSPVVAVFYQKSFRDKPYFPRYKNLEGGEYISAIWKHTVQGASHITNAYGYGKPVRYPAIDEGFYGAKDERLGIMLRFAVETALDDFEDRDLFFSTWSQLTLDLLVIQQRQEAKNLEPLASGENALALRRVKSIDWAAYPYAAIVTLGAGNRQEETGLATIGAFRNRLAARRYRQGLAPVIIVSGGNVHPVRTPDNEAVLMKHDLIKTHGIPEDAIIIEPFARHTTTNLRNTARRFLELEAPEGASLLLTTSASQSRYIEGDVFRVRNENELGYQPQFVKARLSEFDLVMHVNLMSRQLDPSDPLDP